METERLYLNDPLLERFEARVVARAKLRGRAALILDRSAFYPESGGQEADRGTLAGLAVVDVQKNAHGQVLHFLDGELPALGDEVEGRIDLERRRQHMAQHTGQHLLSAAVLKLADARTLSSHLGTSACTLDVDRGDLDWEQLLECEALVNRLIDEDRAVRTWFPSAEELEGLVLRRSPKVAENIRVVSIGDFDHTPCGGTHCLHTSQVGLLVLLAAERYKGGTRISFVTGAKARALAHQQRDGMKQAAARLDCSGEQVPERLDGLMQQLDDAQQRNKQLQKTLAEEIAARLRRVPSEQLRVAYLDGQEAELLLSVGQHLVDGATQAVILAAPEGERLKVLAIRGADSDFDCGAFIRALCAAGGGKGGGRPDHAQGVLPLMDEAAWMDLVRRAGLA